MRITVDIKGFYDWVPCPPGTEITQEDIQTLRVKKMVDEKWAMRVTVPSPDPDQHHVVGLHEQSIVSMLAAKEVTGPEMSREECVADLLRRSFQHHLHPSHLVKIHVDDAGPDEALYRAALVAVGVTDPARQDEAVQRYMEPDDDLADYLNRNFKTESFKKAQAAAKAKTKEA